MLEQLVEIFTAPFMQRAIIGGVLVAVLTSWIGILVVLRQSSFYGDAIAHASLTGVALGLLINLNPILIAALYAVLVSFVLPYLKRHSELPIDSLLGITLSFSMAIGVILLAFMPGYQPELISFLFGSVLAISWVDVLVIFGLVLVTIVITTLLTEKLIFASFDNEYAKVSGIKVEKIDIIYQILLAVTIVAGIRLVGIILVNALLVIPASTTRLFSKSLKQMFILTPFVATSVVLLGLFFSYVLNIPSGPTIAVISGSLFLIGIGVKKIIS